MTRPCTALAALAALAAALAGCDTIGNPITALSSKKLAPDEFQVIVRRGLERPPGLDASTLPEPRPGAPSPLDPDPQADAIAALTGAAPPPRATAISRGEEALLAAADAQAASPEIRALVAAETREIEENKPYRPPTIFELLSGREEIDPETVIDPAAESRRLQESGVPTPTSPRALAREAERQADEAEERAAAEPPAEPGSIGRPRFRDSIPNDSITD